MHCMLRVVLRFENGSWFWVIEDSEGSRLNWCQSGFCTLSAAINNFRCVLEDHAAIMHCRKP